MDVSAVGDNFDGDWFDLEEQFKSTANGHSFEILSGSFDPRNDAILVMMKPPSEASVRGGYSQEQGFKVDIEVSWKNDPGPPPSQERERSRERESTNNEKGSSSRESSSERENDSSIKS